MARTSDSKKESAAPASGGMSAIGMALRGYVPQQEQARTQVAGSFDATPDYERALKFVTQHGADAAMLDKNRMFVRLPVTGADGSEMNEDHVVPVGPDGSVDWKMIKSLLGY